MSNHQIVETDVLIIGSEAAGSRAAIEAKKHGVRVTVVTKGRVAKSGATLTAVGDIDVDSRSAKLIFNQPGDERDTHDCFFEDIVKEGKYLNNQQLVEILVAEATTRVKEIVDWGMKITGILLAPGHRYPRGLRMAGVDMVRILKSQLKKSGSEIYEDTIITDLIRESETVVGATGVDLTNGEFKVFKAKAVILATGGAMQIWPLTTAPEELTGDGYAMAYRSGAELVDMEFPMFMPTCVVHPPMVRGSQFPYAMITYFGGWLYNRAGERFMIKWDPIRMEHSTRDVVSIAVANEILEGRGGPRGGVYVSLKHIPDNLLADATHGHPVINNWKFYGFNLKDIFDPTKEAIQVAPASHYFNGGIKVNARCETGVPGLYAAGENAGGFMGANRISGMALTQTLVTGLRAGRYAAEFAKAQPEIKLSDYLIGSLRSKAFRALESREGIPPVLLRKKLQKLASENLGPLRNGESLRKTLSELEEIKLKELPRVATKHKHRRYNREWVESLQLTNMISVLEIVTRASLMRTESRGAMYRQDFPDINNDEWLKNIVIRQGRGGMEFRTEPIVVTKLKPPTGIRKYPG